MYSSTTHPHKLTFENAESGPVPFAPVDFRGTVRFRDGGGGTAGDFVRHGVDVVGEFLLAVGDGGVAVGVEAEDALVAVAEAGEDGVEFLGGGGGIGWHCFFFLGFC